MTEGVERSVIEPVNPKLNVSRNANLPHSPGIRVGDYIFLSGMGPVDPVSGGRNLGPIAEQIRQTLRIWRTCSNPPDPASTASSR
jgi:enamine deaminase RidA (YjgF/YER057c/UK114 family)